jgi:hypothetical protein
MGHGSSQKILPTSGRTAYDPPATFYATRNRLGSNISGQPHGKSQLTVDPVNDHDESGAEI